jgi:hypothetical protein
VNGSWSALSGLVEGDGQNLRNSHGAAAKWGTLIRTPAKTLEGLRAKAKAVAWCHLGVEEFEEEFEIECLSHGPRSHYRDLMSFAPIAEED